MILKRMRKSLTLKWTVLLTPLAVISLTIACLNILQIYHEDLKRSFIAVEGIVLILGILFIFFLTKKVILTIKRMPKKVEEELVKRTRELEVLNEIGGLINQNLGNLDTVLPITIEKVANLTGYEMGVLFLLNEAGDILEMKSQIGHSPAMLKEVKVLKSNGGVAGEAIRLKQPVIVSISEYPSSRIGSILREEGVQTVAGIPLMAKGKAIGAIILSSRFPRKLSPREVNSLESIGNQIGIFLENTKLFSTVAKAKSEWETTFDAVTDLITIRDKDYRIIRANKAAFKRFGLKPEEMIGKICFETLQKNNKPCEGCYVTEALKTKKPTSGERDSKYLNGKFQYFAFPVYDEIGEVVAVVDLAREITEEKRTQMEKEIVNRVNRIFASSLDLKQGIRSVYAELKKVLDCERMTIALFDEDGKGFRYFALEKDYEAGELVGDVLYPMQGTRFERMAKSGEPEIVGNTEIDSWIGRKLLQEERIRSVLLFPLEYKGKIFGTVNFGSTKLKHFSEDQFNLLRQIAPGLAIFIQNVLLFSEIKRSEEKYRAVVENAIDGVCVIGKGHLFKYVNERLAEIHGYRREELIGTDIRNFLDEESRALLADREDKRARGIKLSPHFELNFLHKDGGTRNAEISASAIKDSKGDVNIVVFVRDITDRKQAEDALRQSEEEARRLSQENATVAEIGRIISSTLNIEEVYERFAEEVRKVLPFDRVSVNTINPDRTSITIAYAVGVKVEDIPAGTVLPLDGLLNESIVTKRSSFLIQARDENEVALHSPNFVRHFRVGLRSMMAVPLISKDEVIGILHIQSLKPHAYTESDVRMAEKVGNQIAGAIANAQLFIERKQAEEALRTEKQKFQTVSENAPFGMAMTDQTGTFKYINPKFKELFGYDLSDIPDGKTWFRKAFPDPAYRHQVISTWIDDIGSQKPGEKIIRIFRVTCKDGAKKISEFSPVKLETGEHLTSFVDITRRKEAEDALQRSEEAATRLAQENATVAEIGRIISSTLNIEEVYERFAEEARKLIPFDRIALTTMNPDHRSGTMAYTFGVEVEDRNQGNVFPLVGSFYDEIFSKQSGILVQTEDESELVERYPILLSTFRAGLLSMISVPLISKGQLIGVLHIRSLKPNAYTELDLKLAEKVGNQIAGAIANVQLFTERKQMEEALRENENRLQALLDASPIGISWADMNGNIQYTNRKFVQLFGYTVDDIPTVAEWRRLAYPDPAYRETVPSLIAKLTEAQKQGREIRPIEMAIKCKDGSTRYVEQMGTFVSNRILAIYKDLTERRKMEEALRESENKFRSLVENSIVGVYLIQEGIFKYVNARLAEIHGYEVEEMVGKMGPTQAIFPEDLPIVERNINKRLKGEVEAIHYEFRIVTKSQEIRCVEVFGSRMIYQGMPTALGTMLDITDRKKAEEALRQSEEEARRLSQENAVIAEIGRIISSTLDINEVYERFAEEVRKLIPFDRIALTTMNPDHRSGTMAYAFGVEVKHRNQGNVFPLVGSFYDEVFSKRSGILVQTEDESELAERYPILLSTFRAGLRSMISVPLISKGQVIGVLHIRSLKPNAYTELDLKLAERVGNQIAGAIANAQLYFERSQVEEALRRSEERYRTILEDIQEGYFEVDHDGNFTFVNDAECRNLGYSKEELIGMGNQQYTSQNSVKKMYDLFNKVYSTGKPAKGYNLELIKKDGTKTFSEISVSLLRNSEGEKIGFRGISRNVTERKRMEEQLLQAEKLRAIGEMASGVAHDFNNALAAILGNTQLLLYTAHDEELKETLKIIEKVAKDSGQTVRRLQDFTRKRVDEELFKVDVNAIIRDSIEITKPKWKDEPQSRGIRIEMISNLDEIPSVSGNASELREVITNMIFNAIEAMPEGGKIEIRTFKKRGDVFIQISDSGIGIAEEVGKKIFEPFFTTKPFTNTGLGLSMSYGIIKRFGGEIEVESQVGQGTTFTIILPIGGEEKEEAVSPQPIKKGREARILVIDDDEFVRNVLSRTLAQAKHQVTLAENGEKGIQVFKEGKFDIVLTDLGMPGMSGWEVCRIIKEISPHTPVGMITGWGMEKDRNKVEEVGLDFFISKPFDFNQILNVVSKTVASEAE